MVGQRQAYERDDEPGDEQQVAERGEALLQPVAGAVIGRADTAHAAEGRSVTHGAPPARYRARSEEHTSELQSLMRTSYAVFCLKKKTKRHSTINTYIHY